MSLHATISLVIEGQALCKESPAPRHPTKTTKTAFAKMPCHSTINMAIEGQALCKDGPAP
eukprot:1470360-Ditylum_brightwellii.AAC.1